IARIDEAFVYLESTDESCQQEYDGPNADDNSPGQPDENGCVFWKGDPSLVSAHFCLTQNPFVYCPCEFGTIYEGNLLDENSPEGVDYMVALRDVPVLSGRLSLEATYVQIAPTDNNYSGEVLATFTSGGVSNPQFSVEVLQTSFVHEENILGQPVVTEDSKGLFTEFLYDEARINIWDYCYGGEIIENATTSMSRNLGLPIAVTVGYGYDPVSGLHTPQTDELRTDYTYYPNKLVETITDPNGIVIKYEYDEFNRLWKTYRNDQLIAENDYNNWDNISSDDFLQRARKNYVQSRTLLDDDHYSEITSYVDPLGRSIGEVNNAVSSNGATTAAVTTNSHFYDIYGRIAVTAPPAPGSAPGLLPSDVSNDGYINFELDIAPRARAVTTAKPGLPVNGDFTVNNEYCLVTKTSLSDEISAAGNLAGVGILPDLSFYMRTVTTDEDKKQVIS
ncbi:MAG: hypothetical protein AAFN65_13605, partial [Bacteroidota bacterium]